MSFSEVILFDTSLLVFIVAKEAYVSMGPSHGWKRTFTRR